MHLRKKSLKGVGMSAEWPSSWNSLLGIEGKPEENLMNISKDNLAAKGLCLCNVFH